MNDIRNEINILSPVPLYHQLRGILEQRISGGEFNNAPAFLSESEICEMYSVSRTTVRQTLREMRSDGLLYKKNLRGRLQVTPKKVNQKLTRLHGFFTEDVLNSGRKPQTTVLSLEEVRKKEILLELGLKKNEKAYKIHRLHGGGGENLAIQNSYIPKKVLPTIADLDLSKSLVKYIEELYPKPIVRAKQGISMRLASQQERDLFQLSSKASVFQLNRTTYAEDGTVVEYFECVMNGERYDFTMESEFR